ncbi:Alpha-1,3-mannosyl-glycoprotein 4-beta-N-acetylglucosaminyltransferase A [Chelonia mydas]|uniref:Alpha-1,3-mannosyl-glycoprotein 4-beta-N-acetylglucosaminyltransferase A n=1 Tax=Chelonia mydas TaxID=8469 RepID=M7ARB7_CHEMY|nr:Alpha-1,3-mannosyl-glycoprotein 4-beta-N-acetylglucosaminyltransferase A [Chelonia mydas]
MFHLSAVSANPSPAIPKKAGLSTSGIPSWKSPRDLIRTVAGQPTCHKPEAARSAPSAMESEANSGTTTMDPVVGPSHEISKHAHKNGKKLIAYQREFHALKERLRIAEHRTLQRSSELNAILEQFRRAVAETNGSKDALNNFSDETLKLLKELISRKSLQVPNIYYHLPHLLKNEGSLQPSVQIGLGRTGVSIVMGIPTVKRKVKSYLTETLHSLIDKLSPEEKLDCVMVVFIGEKRAGCGFIWSRSLVTRVSAVLKVLFRNTMNFSHSSFQPLARDCPGAGPYCLDDLPGVGPHRHGTALHRGTSLCRLNTAQWTDASLCPLSIGLCEGSAGRLRFPQLRLGHLKGNGLSRSWSSTPWREGKDPHWPTKKARHLQWQQSQWPAQWPSWNPWGASMMPVPYSHHFSLAASGKLPLVLLAQGLEHGVEPDVSVVHQVLMPREPSPEGEGEPACPPAMPSLDEAAAVVSQSDNPSLSPGLF